jgi:hypothetical protein
MSARELEGRIRNLQEALPVFAQALRHALDYIDPDPGSSLTKSRGVLEKILIELYRAEMGQDPRKPMLAEMLVDNQFTRKLERRLVSRMDAIRDLANLGPHLEGVKPSDAELVLNNLCEVLEWYVQRPAPPAESAPAPRGGGKAGPRGRGPALPDPARPRDKLAQLVERLQHAGTSEAQKRIDLIRQIAAEPAELAKPHLEAVVAAEDFYARAEVLAARLALRNLAEGKSSADLYQAVRQEEPGGKGGLESLADNILFWDRPTPQSPDTSVDLLLKLLKGGQK